MCGAADACDLCVSSSSTQGRDSPSQFGSCCSLGEEKRGRAKRKSRRERSKGRVTGVRVRVTVRGRVKCVRVRIRVRASEESERVGESESDPYRASKTCTVGSSPPGCAPMACQGTQGGGGGQKSQHTQWTTTDTGGGGQHWEQGTSGDVCANCRHAPGRHRCWAPPRVQSRSAVERT